MLKTVPCLVQQQDGGRFACYFSMGFTQNRPQKQPDAKALRAYVDVILETAKQFEIPVLDLYETLGIDPCDPKDNETYSKDGLHFNDAGHAILAQRLHDFIEVI